MNQMPPRKAKYRKALEPILEPGDVVLVVCNDDSHTLLFGKDYRDAYALGQWTPKHTFPSVALGAKILGELLAGHMQVCLPNQGMDLGAVKPVSMEKFQASMRAGTLTPDETFTVVAMKYRELMIVLEGHMASCMPNECRKLAEALKNDPDHRLYDAGGKKTGGDS